MKKKSILDRLLGIPAKSLYLTSSFLMLFGVLFTVSFIASTKNIDILSSIKVRSFPSLENIDKSIFLVEKLKTTLQAAVALADEDELEEAKKIYKEIRKALLLVNEVDPSVAGKIDAIITNLDSYYEKSSDFTIKFINEEVDFSSSSKELALLNDSVISLDASLKKFRDSRYKTFTSSILDATNSSINSQEVGLFILLATILLSLFLLITTQFVVVRPLVRLARASEQVGAGTLDTVDASKSRDEIGVLNRNFNGMVTKIKTHTDQLEFIREESLNISSSFTFAMLREKILDAFAKYSEQKNIQLFIANSCYLNLDLEEAYYLIDESGMPTAEILEDISDEDSNKDGTQFYFKAYDLRNRNLLAVVVLRESLDESTYAVLNSFPSSIANALSTIRLEAANTLIERKTSQISTIFANITQGICTIDVEGKIGSQYSQFLETILSTESLKGTKLVDQIFQDSNLKEDQRASILAALNASFGGDRINFELNSGLLPCEIQRGKDEESKRHLELDWLPLVDSEGNVQSMMVTIRDVTTLQKLRHEAEESKSIADKIMQIVGTEEYIYNDVISRCQNTKQYLTYLKSQKEGSSAEDGKLLKRDLHTIKGSARSARMSFLTDAVHNTEEAFEQIFKEFGNEGCLTQEALSKIDLTEFNDAWRSYADIEERYLGRSGKGQNGEGIFKLGQHVLRPAFEALRMISSQEGQESAISIVYEYLKNVDTGVIDFSGLVRQIFEQNVHLAAECGLEKPELDFVHRESELLLKNEFRSVIADTMNHLYGNSFYHGFRGQKEDKQHLIYLEVKQDIPEHVTIEYSDNGKGLNLKKLSEKAAHKFGVTADKLHIQQIAEVIFMSGLSTAEKAGNIAGRGVGMDIVKKNIENLGGKLVIELFGNPLAVDEFAKFKLVLTLPSKAFVKADLCEQLERAGFGGKTSAVA